MTEAQVQANAGVLPGVARQTLSGNQTITSSLANTTVNGSLTIGASNVTLTNVQVTSATYLTGKAGVTFNNVEFDAGVWVDGANAGLTFYRDQFENANGGPHLQVWDNGGRTSNLSMTQCWFHGLVSYGAHSNAHTANVHLAGVQGALIQHNSFSIQSPDGSTTGVYITANFETETAAPYWNESIVLDANWFHYAWYYHLYLNVDNAGVNSPTAANRVTNNEFDSTAAPGGPSTQPQFPPSAYTNLPTGGYQKFYQAGNTDQHGNAVNLPGGF